MSSNKDSYDVSSPLRVECGLKQESNDAEVNDAHKEIDDGLPIDRGWAWFVLLGSFLNIAIMTGYTRGMSILFVEYLRIFNAATAKTTLLLGVYAGVNSICSLVTMHVMVTSVGIRKTVLAGATISVLGMGAAIFPTSIDFLIGVHSSVVGLGHSMILGPAILSIGHYFKKRRGFASAFALSGISFGGIIFPPLLRYLLDEYGIQGTMLVMTGINMNMFVGAAVNIPIESFRVGRTRTSCEEDCVPREKELHKLIDNKNNSKEPLRVTRVRSDEFGDIVLKKSPYLNCPLTKSIESLTSHKSVTLYTSHADLGSAISIADVVDESRSFEEHSTIKNLCFSLDVTMFKNPIFLLIIAYTFFIVPISLTIAYLPALAAENGLHQQDAALFLSILGALDFACRLLAGVIVDRRYIKVNNFMGAGMFVLGSASLLNYFYSTYTMMLIYTVILGVFACTYFGVYSVAIVEFLGLDYLGKTLGFVALAHGASLAIANPVLGGIRDWTGSYNGGFSYVACSAIVGGVLLFCEPLVTNCEKKSQDHTMTGKDI